MFYPPKATVCKAGETPSAKQRGGHNREGHNYEGHNHGGHHQEGHHQEGNNPEGHNRGGHNRDVAPHYGGHGGDVKDGVLPAAPALVARSNAPVPTDTFLMASSSDPAPTDPPKEKNGSRHRREPHTKTGNDGTVTVFDKDAFTPCRAAPTEVPADGKIASRHKKKSNPKEHMEAGDPEDVLSQPRGAVKQPSAPGGDDKPALVKRAVDLLEYVVFACFKDLP
ncbi:hypothetical protein C0993_007746 [Termitomyces sp. T159_Od127]|nr:hypothetical protein C0993_007746 [Termitomyces sp. T159_Od127]